MPAAGESADPTVLCAGDRRIEVLVVVFQTDWHHLQSESPRSSPRRVRNITDERSVDLHHDSAALGAVVTVLKSVDFGETDRPEGSGDSRQQRATIAST